MKTVSFTEFRNNASEVLNLVENGQTIRILMHGKAVAKIVPMNAHENIPAWKRPATPLVIPGVSISKVLLEERRSSR